MLGSFFEKYKKNKSLKNLPIGPVDLLVTNALMVTCSKEMEVFQDGALAIKDGKILAIGNSEDLSVYKENAARIIDAKGRILMPGLINTHCHAGDSLFRGLVEGLPLEPWLEKLWIAESAILNADTILLGSQLGYAENLLNGVTSVMDMFWMPAYLVKAAETVGIRVATGGIFFDPPGIDKVTADQREKIARQFFDDHDGHSTLLPTVSVHGAYTVSPESLKIAVKVREDYDALLTIHAAETRAEQKLIQDQYGTSVIRHINNLGLLSSKSVLAHCVHLDDEEIEILATTRATASHNPASNLKLGSGIAKVPQMLAKNVRVALGTDGAVSGNDIDMWKAIRFAAILHNGVTQNAQAMEPATVIDMATRQGAIALGIEDEAGSLEVGKRADFILVNPNQVHGVPIFDPLNYLAYSASHNDVEDVFVAGRQLVQNRKILTVDIDDIIDRVNILTPKIKATLN